MNREEAELFAKIVSKYSLAIGCCLYPSQVNCLIESLCYWREHEEMPEIEDAFTRLAFLMIISDLLYEEREKGGKTDGI